MSAFQGYSATDTQVEELFHILSLMRPHLSGMEAKFIDHYLKPLNPEVDDCGNLWVRVGKAPVVWSCHVDTVHTWGGIAPLKLYDDGLIKLHPKSRANCLGADDGAGVWLMLQMIRAKREGLYIFHRGEERGGIGSRWIAKNAAHRLDGIEAAIAFDRKDKTSIITHQWGGRCCSDVFAGSLSEAIGLDMKTDTTGSFTDTACYTDLIGECTNVSVGYKWQHGKTEEQDLLFLLSLLDRLLDLNTDDLIYLRKPGEKEKKSWTSSWRGNGGSDASGVDDYSDNTYYRDHGGSSYYSGPKYRYEQGKIWSQQAQGYVWPDSSGKVWDDDKKVWAMKKADEPAKGVRTYMDTNNRWRIARASPTGDIVSETYAALIRDYPEQIAKLLEDKVYGMGYLHDFIRKNGGKIVTTYLPKEGEKDDKSETRRSQASGIVCSTCQRLPRFCSCEARTGKAN